MQFPNLQSQDATIAGGQSPPLLESLEPMPLNSLEFPSLISNAGLKRAAYQAPSFPAKRRKSLTLADHHTVTQQKEDDSWIDNFSLLDSLYPEDSSSKPSTSFSAAADPSWKKHQQTEVNVEELIKKALDVSAQDTFAQPQAITSLPMNQAYANGNNNNNSNGYLESSNLQTGAMDQETIHQVRVISQTPMTDTDGIPHQPTMVSPSLNAIDSSVSQHQVPPIAMPQQQQPMVDSSAFTISKLKNSKEPTLLTLTSYPFRVVYSNEAFSKLSSGRKASVIGDSVFDTFNMEGRILRPSLATYPTLTGRLDNEIALVPSFVDEQTNNEYSVRCALQAYPVTKRNDSNALRYFAVRFTPL